MAHDKEKASLLETNKAEEDFKGLEKEVEERKQVEPKSKREVDFSSNNENALNAPHLQAHSSKIPILTRQVRIESSDDSCSSKGPEFQTNYKKIDKGFETRKDAKWKEGVIMKWNY